MAITTDTTVDITFNGDVVNTYGISKTLDNYTTDDILNYVYCSASHRGLFGFYAYAENANIMDYNSSLPFSVIKGNSGRIILDVPRGSALPLPQGAYEYIVWLQKASTGTLDQILTVDNVNKYKMITEMPSNKMLYELPNPAGTKDSITSWSGGTGAECYATDTSYGSLSYVHRVGGVDNLIGISDTHPYMIIKQDNTIFFWRINMESVKFYCRPFSHGVYGVMYVGGKVHTAFNKVKYSAVGNNLLTLDNPNVLPYEWSTGTGSSMSSNPQKWGTCAGDNIVYAHGGGNQADILGTFRLEFSINTKDKALLFWAACGVYFKTSEKTYKPIIEGGYVTGYTDDLDKKSDLDEWEGSTKHTVPSGPPQPPSPNGDDYEDMSLGVSNITLGGLTKYAILSKQELIDLVIDYNTNGATAGTNFSNHIICLYRLGFGASDLVVTSSDKIKMIQSAGNVDFESSANYSIVSRQTPFIHFGSITVPRHTDTFYDFSPYSNYELYIPGCGWIPLPDNVAGRTLNVYLVFDLPTCSAKGIVRIAGGVYGGTTIATVNGIIGASVPFTIGENGMQRAAILSGSVQTAAALGTAFLGVGIGNPYMGASGVAMATTGIANNYVAGNTNFISTKGGASDFSAFGDGATAMLKYNSPEIDPVVNNTMFGHTVGYLCNEVGKLSTFSGFTVCDNPHVTFSASSEEREEIERLLSMGVIL